MTTRFKASLAAALAAVTMATAAPLLIAQDQPQRREGPGRGGPDGPGGPGMRGPGFGPGFRGLDLSDDQQAQLKKIRDARQAEFKAAGDKLRAAHQGMRALVEADSINEAAIRAKSQEVAAADAEVAILNAKLRKESMQILTAEQLATLKEQRDNREGQMKQRRPRGRQ